MLILLLLLYNNNTPPRPTCSRLLYGIIIGWLLFGPRWRGGAGTRFSVLSPTDNVCARVFFAILVDNDDDNNNETLIRQKSTRKCKTYIHCDSYRITFIVHANVYPHGLETHWIRASTIPLTTTAKNVNVNKIYISEITNHSLPTIFPTHHAARGNRTTDSTPAKRVVRVRVWYTQGWTVLRVRADKESQFVSNPSTWKTDRTLSRGPFVSSLLLYSYRRIYNKYNIFFAQCVPILHYNVCPDTFVHWPQPILSRPHKHTKVYTRAVVGTKFTSPITLLFTWYYNTNSANI